MGIFSKDSFSLFAFNYCSSSLWRNRRRSTLTLLTVIFSVTFTIVGRRFGDSMMTLWQVSAEDTGLGHAQIHGKGYWESSEGIELDTTLVEGNAIETALDNDPAVESYTKRLKIEGIISPYSNQDYDYDDEGDPTSEGTKVIYFIGIGVDPSHEMEVSPQLFVPKYNKKDEGTFIQADNPKGVVIGAAMAKTLKLKIGDDASLLAHTAKGSQNAVDVKIIGILDVPLPSFSKRVVYMHKSLAQQLVRLGKRYTELAVRLKDREKAEEWVAGFHSKVDPNVAELRGWWQIDPIIRNVEDIMDTVISVISGLLFLSAGLSLLNMIYVLVAERTVEIGTLMAIGARPRDIRRIFTLEAAMLGLIGGAIGAVVGNIVVVIMNIVGIPFKNPFASGLIHLHPEVSIAVTLFVTLVAIIMCVVSAIAPSHKASKVEPVQAFRGQIT
ncbi:FtsX-like permease family protein [Oligoflexaceae bacterium]|nr:FtsX-like permease family protein [Oligoflexaceae bacterium]